MMKPDVDAVNVVRLSGCKTRLRSDDAADVVDHLLQDFGRKLPLPPPEEDTTEELQLVRKKPAR